MGKDTEEIKRWKEVKEIEEEEEIDSIANQDRRVVDMSRKTVNLGHKRCTEMKRNR